MNREVATHSKPSYERCPVCRGDGALIDPKWKPREINGGHQGYRPCRRCGGFGKVLVKSD